MGQASIIHTSYVFNEEKSINYAVCVFSLNNLSFQEERSQTTVTVLWNTSVSKFKSAYEDRSLELYLSQSLVFILLFNFSSFTKLQHCSHIVRYPVIPTSCSEVVCDCMRHVHRHIFFSTSQTTSPTQQ